MNDKYFLDTNIIVYSFDFNAPHKKERAIALISTALKKQNACISYQVIQEFLHVALTKFYKPISSIDAQNYLSSILEPLCEIFSSIPLYHKAIDLKQRWKFSFYDSLIIAAALLSNCKILYSEDLQHEQKIESLVIINPFV